MNTTLGLKRSSECRDDVVAHERKVLEERIAHHADTIVELKMQLNTMTPIARLPPEILAEIFALVSTTQYEESWRRHYGSSQVYKWLSVAHVCRVWRAIALDTPRLWSRIVLTRPEVDKEVLARSKKAPLWISANIHHQDDERAALLNTIMEDSVRLKELHLTGPARALQHLSAKWTNRADALEFLSLNSAYRLFDHASFFATPPLSANLFSGHVPRLRHLSICRLNVGWTSPLFCSTLRTLTIDARNEHSDSTGEFSHLLDALDNMQFLEKLSLTDAVPRLPDEVVAIPETQRAIRLPRLRVLEVYSDAIDCARLLRHLAIPRDVKLKLTARTERGSEDFVQALSDQLGQANHLLSVRLERRSISQVHLRGWWSVIKSRDPVFDIPPEPDVDVYMDTTPFGQSVHSLVANATFLSHTKRLLIEPTSRNWYWRLLLAQAPELRELSLIAEADDGFLPALSAILDTAPSENNDAVACPRLHTLELYGARFGCSHSDHESQWLEDMVEWLIARCNAETPIQQLDLRMCVNADEDDVSRLAEIVPELTWDGRVSYERASGMLDSEEEDAMDDDYEDEEVLFPLDPTDFYDDDADLELWMIPFGW
ncbi:hypothetical protein ACG7TL_005658 [Trametes sanguinea]